MAEPISPSVGGVSSVVGRYFAIVSFIPSLLLVTWALLLAGTGAWSGPPDWARSLRSLTDVTVSGIVVFLLVAIVVAALLHPLQFALVQMLEGYWGTSKFAVRLRTLRTKAYVAKRLRLVRLETAGLPEDDEPDLDMSLVAGAEAARKLTYLPESPWEMLPTRLGNVLRRHELDAGREYNLPVLTFAGQLAHVAPTSQVQYVNDQRTALDFAVKCCLVGLLGATAAVIFMWQHGMWLTIALVPYLIAYGSYRGAVVVAHEYGKALEDLVTLNRFALYERLRLQPPTSTELERQANVRLRHLVDHHSDVESVPYELPPPDQGVVCRFRDSKGQDPPE